MTSIEKLSISGVRSFNPNVAERQVIEFHKPLTVILGKNGAGKTTIIESLLNATTGEMPPGAAGAEKCSFIYDPKIVGETEVKAQIRLTFTARGGQSMQVIRSFQATQSKTKTSFQTLDSTLAFKEAVTGKIKSGTYRHSDVDRIVPDLLGVSKAVLEHVVFCHQEEANWPLGVPSQVKTIFDDIFASTRYVAALDKLRESSKEYKSQQRQNEQVIIALKEHREQARALKKEIETKENEVEKLRQSQKGIEPQIAKLSDAIRALDSVSHEADSIIREMDVVRGRIDEKTRVLRTFNLPQSKQTLEELETLDRNFESHMQKLNDEVSKKQGQIEMLEQERIQVQSRLGENAAQLKIAQSEDLEHKRRVKDLQSVIAGISSGEFVAGEAAMDEHALLAAEEKVRQKASKARDDRAKACELHEVNTRDLRKGHDNILRAMDAGSQEKSMKESHLSQLQKRQSELQRSLPQNDPTATVTALTSEIEGLKAALEELAKKRAEGSSYKRSEELVKKVAALNSKISALHKEHSELKQSGEDLNRLKYMKEQMNAKTEEAENLLKESVLPLLTGAGAALPKLKAGGQLPSLNQVGAAWDALKQKKTLSLSKCEQEHRDVDLRINLLQGQLQTKQKEMRTKTDQFQQSKAVCVSVLGNEEAIDEYATLLKQAEEKQAKRQRQITSIESLAKSYESFISSAKSDHQCVVCKRPLNDTELKEFVKINEARQKNTPAQLEKANTDFKASQDMLDKYRRIEKTVREVATLKEEIPKLQAEIQAIDNEISEKKAVLADVDTKKRELVKQDGFVDNIKSEIVKVTSILDSVKNMEVTVAQEEAKVTTSLGGGNLSMGGALMSQRNIDVVDAELEEATSELQDANKELHSIQAALGGAGGAGANGSDEDKLKTRLMDKQNQLMEATLQSKRAEDVKKSLGELEKEIGTIKSRFAELNAQRTKLQEELDASSAKIKSVTDAWTVRDNKALNEVHKLEHDCSTLQTSSGQIRAYIKNQSGNKLQATMQNQKLLEDEMSKKEQSSTKLKSEVAEKRKVLDEQHQRKNQIQQHIHYQRQVQECDRDKVQMTTLEKRLVELKASQIKHVESILGGDQIGGGANNQQQQSFSRTRDLCQAKIAELQTQRATFQGALETMVRDVAERRSNLAKDKYRDIDKRYTSTFIKVQTTELAVQDIEKYYRALEKAVSTYHQEKIAQVNQLIAEMWRATYRGSDIDTIEVRSEDESSGTISKRSYKYRVVMKRGDRELDMRGRCSAGQKVLASVIIRLALSEAFCCDCGILALDEPTTNLDEDNARSLAEGLKDLISTRRTVKHFQLVVITHDEDFVRALGGQHADHFYFVQKDREGAFSTIARRRYGDLFA